jgi:transcriptional regulator with XRE-family HTH domain
MVSILDTKVGGKEHLMVENWELKAIRQQLKDILKQKRLSYRELAKNMKVSEITVKRFFIHSDISFCRLQQICDAIGLSVLELVAMVEKGNEKTFQLTEKQEQYLSKNERLYDFFVLVLKTRSISASVKKGRFDDVNIPRFLRELKSLDLIELPVGDKIHVKRTGTLTWRKRGPLQKKFMRQRHERYLTIFEQNLDEPLNFLTSSQRHMRPESVEEMKRDLEFVIQKFRDRAYVEETTCAEDQLVGVAWLTGLGKYEHN